jgi:hypothetical protein
MVSKMKRRGLAQFLMPMIAGYVLLCVAILNGYPLLFPDSGDYIVKSFTLEVPPYRTIFYSIFMRLTNFGISPWLVVVAQSAVTVFVLFASIEYLCEHKGGSTWKSRLFVGVVLLLVCGTSLPWYVGQLMPDIFTGLLILCLFLLLYDSQLSTETSVCLAFLIMLCIAFHNSHLFIAGLILVTVGSLRVLSRTRFLWPTRSKKQITMFVLVPIVVGAFAVAFSNRHDGMGFVSSPGGHMFLLGRLFASGMAGSFLQQDCKLETLIACRYLDKLPRSADDFLWGDNPLFKAMGGWLESKPEATRIIVGSIRYNPGRFLGECLKQTFRQFVRMKPGDGNSAYHPFVVEVLKTFYPQDTHKWELTMQWNEGLRKLAKRVSGLYIAVFWLSMGCCLVVLALRWPQTDAASKLFVFVFIALLSNALITGSLSEVADRYQSRVSWLMAFCLLGHVLSRLSRRQKMTNHALLEPAHHRQRFREVAQ